MTTTYFLYPLISYFSGSIPSGLILSNLFGNGKLRELGSKNIGATNVLRTQGKLLGALTLLFDFSKAFLPCYFLKTDNEFVNMLILAAPAMGHMFSIWLKFQGGKGVATYFGLLCAIDIHTCLITAMIWLCTFFICRISSIACLSSIILSCGVLAYVRHIKHLEFFNQLCVLIILAIFIVAKHHENIKRLLSDKELKF